MKKPNTSLCYFSWTFSILVLGCAHPTDLKDGEFAARTPEEVAANLTRAYKETRLDGYVSIFSEDCRFLYGGEYLWGKTLEQKIHRRMFGAAKSIELKLTDALNEEVTKTNRRTLSYYYLKIQLRSEETFEAQGLVELELVKNTIGTWQINSFRELDNSLQKAVQSAPEIHKTDDAADYFPLRVGNTWLYKDRLITTHPETLRTTVTDSVVLHGKRFYRVKNHLYTGYELVRLDSLKLKAFVEEDSTELTVLDLNASIGDTLIIISPYSPEPFIVELLDEKDSLTVPAGTFKNVKEFLVMDNNSGSAFLYYFAEGVGLIRQDGTNTINELISARVNDVVVSIKARDLDWTKIKMSFN
jgi:hypothetical protein